MEKHLKKAKTWNMVLIVLTLITVISGIAGLPKTLNPTFTENEVLGDFNRVMFDYLNSPLTKTISILSLVISIILLVLYFRANKSLSDEILPSKLPYYLYIGWSLVALAISLVTTPKMEVEGVDVTFVTTIVGIITNFIFFIPAILVIVHLFKAEPEE